MMSVRSWPARPTKARPCSSSSAPGASPTNISSALRVALAEDDVLAPAGELAAPAVADVRRGSPARAAAGSSVRAVARRRAATAPSRGRGGRGRRRARPTARGRARRPSSARREEAAVRPAGRRRVSSRSLTASRPPPGPRAVAAGRPPGPGCARPARACRRAAPLPRPPSASRRTAAFVSPPKPAPARGHVVGHDQVEVLRRELLPRVLDDVLGLGREAHEDAPALGLAQRRAGCRGCARARAPPGRPSS